MRMLLVEDQQLLADALSAILRNEGIDVSVADTSDDLLDRLRAVKPDVVLVDVGLPDRRGIRAGSRILEHAYPGCRIVALTELDDPETNEEAMRSGFRIFVTKDTGMAELVGTLHEIAEGRAVHAIPEGPEPSGGASPETEMMIRQLTPRELDILEMLAMGATTAEIAEELSISPHTVRSHMGNILAKLQLHSRLEIAVFAIRHQLVDPRALQRHRSA